MLVMCVTSGGGYVAGHEYAAIGWNNGVHILREDADGDVYDFLAVTGGIGDGLFNNSDNSAAPSFDLVERRIVKTLTRDEYGHIICENLFRGDTKFGSTEYIDYPSGFKKSKGIKFTREE